MLQRCNVITVTSVVCMFETKLDYYNKMYLMHSNLYCQQLLVLLVVLTMIIDILVSIYTVIVGYSLQQIG